MWRVAAAGWLSISGVGAAAAEPFPPTSPEFLTLEENHLINTSPPAAPALASVTQAEAAALLRAVAAEKIENRYVLGSCEDRAHYIALLAQKAGLPVAKIWAVAPARYTLLSREMLKVKDPIGIVDHVAWGHHVAPVLRVDLGGGEVRTLVLDVALDATRYIPLKEWTGGLGTPQAVFFFTGADQWLFNSLGPDQPVFNNLDAKPPMSLSIPHWFPNLLTGDFLVYQPARHDPLIARGMAQNDLAMHVFTRLQNHPETERAALAAAIRSEDGLDSLGDAGEVPGVRPTTKQALERLFGERRDHWLNRLATLH
jgi:hypothetical protein